MLTLEHYSISRAGAQGGKTAKAWVAMEAVRTIDACFQSLETGEAVTIER